LGPALFALLGATIFLAYPLTDARHRSMVEEVQERNVRTTPRWQQLGGSVAT